MSGIPLHYIRRKQRASNYAPLADSDSQDSAQEPQSPRAGMRVGVKAAASSTSRRFGRRVNSYDDDDDVEESQNLLGHDDDDSFDARTSSPPRTASSVSQFPLVSGFNRLKSSIAIAFYTLTSQQETYRQV